jgi:hypothetical protein
VSVRTSGTGNLEAPSATELQASSTSRACVSGRLRRVSGSARQPPRRRHGQLRVWSRSPHVLDGAVPVVPFTTRGLLSPVVAGERCVAQGTVAPPDAAVP